MSEGEIEVLRGWARAGGISRASASRPLSVSERTGHVLLIAMVVFWGGYLCGVLRVFGPAIGK